jgi:hypothetical protein
MFLWQGASDLNNAYLRVIARLVLSDAATFLQMFSSIPNENASQNLDKLLDVWWRQVRSFCLPEIITNINWPSSIPWGSHASAS